MKQTNRETRCCSQCGFTVSARSHAAADSALIEHEKFHRFLVWWSQTL